MVLVEGLNYNLTSTPAPKKSIIFVKLTDSALRAIEDFLSREKTGERATLQFLGNEGRIRIPPLQNGQFEFSLQSDADNDPQGSFECIQQSGTSLDSLGSLFYKMRINAKEDSYEATRQRINALEEERLHDCAKEIKNGAIVKAKKITRREKVFVNNGGDHFNHKNNHVTNGGGESVNHKNNHVANGDITKRSLRDRIVHLLAVKPCKKPELINKLTRDGLKEKEKKLSMAILGQISSMRGNEYYLNPGVWNDVDDNWPYWTAEERGVMKRRKPQNLTPPGTGSDTSSSPHSSPPNNHENPGKNDGNIHIPMKRQRISHFTKVESPSYLQHAALQKPNHAEYTPSPTQECWTGGGMTEKVDSDETDSVDSGNGSSTSGGGSGDFNGHRDGGSSGGMSRDVNGHGHGCDAPQHTSDFNSSGHHQPGFHTMQSSHDTMHDFNALLQQDYNYNNMQTMHHQPEVPMSNHQNNSYSSNSRAHEYTNNLQPIRKVPKTPTLEIGNGQNNVSSTTSPTVASSSPEIEHHNRKSRGSRERERERNHRNSSADYLGKYRTIRTPEERARYKTDFNAEYGEYRKMHQLIEKVSQKFAHLEERLRGEDVGSDGYQAIKDEIVREYYANKKNRKYQETKQKFTHLHDKLSHIKNLVLEFDTNILSIGKTGSCH